MHEQFFCYRDGAERKMSAKLTGGPRASEGVITYTLLDYEYDQEDTVVRSCAWKSGMLISYGIRYILCKKDKYQ